MCSLCGKCKNNGLTIGDCAVVPKFKFKNGQLVKVSKLEKIIVKTKAIVSILIKHHITGVSK